LFTSAEVKWTFFSCGTEKWWTHFDKILRPGKKWLDCGGDRESFVQHSLSPGDISYIKSVVFVRWQHYPQRMFQISDRLWFVAIFGSYFFPVFVSQIFILEVKRRKGEARTAVTWF